MCSANSHRQKLVATGADPFQIAAEALERCDRLERQLFMLQQQLQTPASAAHRP